MPGPARALLHSILVLAVTALAAAHAAEPLDTSRLPRLPGAKTIYAGPTSTIVTTADSIERAAEATAKLLAAAGWQAYTDPFSARAVNPAQRIMTFKKGAQAISAFVAPAPAQANATSVSYTAIPLAADLPFPPDAVDVEYVPERPLLRSTTGTAVAPALEFFRKELAARGYSAWPGRAGSMTGKGAYEYFTRDSRTVLILTLERHEGERTRVEIKGVPASVLAAQDRPKPERSETPEQAAAKAEARQRHQALNNAVDNLAADVLRQAQQQLGAPPQAPAQQAAPAPSLRPLATGNLPIAVPDTAEDVAFDGAQGTLSFASRSDVRSIAAFYRDALRQQGWNERRSVINRDNMVVLDFARETKSVSITVMRMGAAVNVSARGNALVTAAAKPAPTETAATAAPAPTDAQDIEADDVSGYPVPRRRDSSGSEKTPFRITVNATVPIPLASVLAFYRRELGSRGWKEERQSAAVEAARASIAFAAPEGPAVLKLERRNDATDISLTVRKTDAAAKAGVLPKSGQGKIVFGNMTEVAASLTVGERTVRVGAGVGANNPDGPQLDLAPGKYKVSVRLGGKPAEGDEVEIGAGETWGVLVGPGGVLPLQVY